MPAAVMKFLFGLSFPRFAWLKSWNPEPFYRAIAKYIVRSLYNPRYSGFEQIPEEGPAILVCNHVSYVDGLIINAGCKRPVRFIIDTYIYNMPGVHYFMRYNRAIPILPTRESVTHALDEVSAALKAGDLVCIFPEGQLTYTGSLGRFKPGIESIIRRDPVPVYPIAINGLWGSIFSRKHLHSFRRFIPHLFGRRIHAVCGTPVAPQDVNVNRLQDTVLRLKYKAME
jgi:1-acyl-sn-glycerol-3-phosphate acyltransferase